MIRRLIIAICLVFMYSISCTSPQNLSKTDKQILKFTIIGDSYSTYDGWNNKGNDFATYYPTSSVTDVSDVAYTWWYKLHYTPEFQLEKLNAYSGSTISYKKGSIVFKEGDKRSFCSRLSQSDMGNPDVIMIFGGTNDAWNNTDADLGYYKYDDFTQSDLEYFRPAFAYMIDYLIRNYPDARIFNITNSGRGGKPEGGLTQGIADSMEEICRHYNITNIILPSILDSGKTNNHPNKEGMVIIFEQVYSALKKDLVVKTI